MGLFDIFKRRNKKEQEQTTEQSETSSTKETVGVSELDSSDVKTGETEVESESTNLTTKSEVKANSSEQDANTEKNETENLTESAEISTEESAESSQEGIQESQANNEEVTGDDKSTSEVSEPNSQITEEKEAIEEAVQSTDEATTESEVETTDEVGKDTSELTDAPVAEVEEKPTDDDIYERGLARSRSTFGQKLNALFANFRSVDESFFTNLEDMLIESDVGFETAIQITDELRDEVKLKNVKKTKEVQNVVIKKMIDIYDAAGNDESIDINFAPEGPTVILFVGVNGVGKTTTIGKMAQMYKEQGKKVLLAAADTFRAGAIAQLNVWAERDGVDIVKGKEQGDPAAVVYDAVKKAKNEDYDILMVDTAGRLQNKVNLMNELAKMKKVITREIPDAPHETLLVLDSTTGQNALNQAKMFKDTTDVSGIVLTKLDGTAKGGIVFAIRNELHLPVKYVGLGEKVTDLQVFDANEFVYGLFKGLIS